MTGALSTWFASRAITQRFEQYVVYEEAASQGRRDQLHTILPPLLSAYHTQNDGWRGVDSTLTELSEMTEERVVLLDADQRLVFDSASELTSGAPIRDEVARPLGNRDPHLRRQCNRRRGRWATFLSRRSARRRVHRGRAPLSRRSTARCCGPFWRRAPAAIALTLALAHGIVRPIEALTAAVRKMENGNLQQRVEKMPRNEIGELAHAFNAMSDSLARVEQLRRNMVSDVAHELRTPLSNIRGYLEAVQDGMVQPSPAVIDSLVEEVMLLNHVVDDLQELAVAEAGQLRLSRQTVRVEELVEKTAQVLRPRAKADNIQMEVDLPTDLPAVTVDPERIGQVMRNLLANAAAYTPPNGRIAIGARQVNGSVQVHVYNSGEGIAPEHAQNVFERFYRVDGSRARATGGSGLGLAIVKQMVEAHGGRIWVESEPGRYADFIFTLPVA